MITPANPLYVIEAFKEWMKAVNDKLPFTVYSQYGHIIEVLENMKQLDKQNQSSLKYPCVILICDFREQVFTPGAFYGQYQDATLNMLIVNSTVNTYKAHERLQHVFKPILYPIYLELMEQIKQSPITVVYGNTQLGHTKIDRLFFGREMVYGNTGNIFNDYIDAIEIQNLRVKLRNNYCKPLK